MTAVVVENVVHYGGSGIFYRKIGYLVANDVVVNLVFRDVAQMSDKCGEVGSELLSGLDVYLASEITVSKVYRAALFIDCQQASHVAFEFGKFQVVPFLAHQCLQVLRADSEFGDGDEAQHVQDELPVYECGSRLYASHE